jgi:hypothetical protein
LYFQDRKPEIAAVISTFLEKWKKDFEETDSNSSDFNQNPDSTE